VSEPQENRAFLAGQFWISNRAGRLITSMHVDLTDLAEQVVTQLSQRS
jgi:hypothetical protein